MSEEDGGWLSLREIVLARRMPRRMLVQPLPQLDKGSDLHTEMSYRMLNEHLCFALQMAVLV